MKEQVNPVMPFGSHFAPRPTFVDISTHSTHSSHTIRLLSHSYSLARLLAYSLRVVEEARKEKEAQG